MSALRMSYGWYEERAGKNILKKAMSVFNYFSNIDSKLLGATQSEHIVCKQFTGCNRASRGSRVNVVAVYFV